MPGVASENGMEFLPCSFDWLPWFYLGVVLPLDGAMGKSGMQGSIPVIASASEAIHPSVMPRDGLLRFARNDGEGVGLSQPHPHTRKSRSGCHRDPGNRLIAASRGR